MGVAFLSPLPPQSSGIADYSAELLPHLARHVDLEVFTERPEESRQVVSRDLPLAGYGDFERRAGSFDLALYQLGNNADFHGPIYDLSVRHPGVVVLHEYMLHHLIQGLSLSRGNSARYVDEMRYCYGETGEKAGRRLLDAGLPIDVWRYPLFERVVDRSLGILAHNESTRRRVLASRPDTLIEVVPHHLALDQLGAADPAGLRTRFEIPEDAFLVASFGFMTPHKRLEVSLAAFAEFHREHPDSRYLLAGDVSPYYDLDALVGGERGAGVVVTGRLELPDLLAAMQACDVAVNLRYPTGGETSGTLMRLLGLGVPVVVSDHGSFAEVPEGCCVKLEIGELEVTLLVEYLRRLACDAGLARQLGQNARRYMSEAHTLQGSAAGYAAFLTRVAERRPTPYRAVPPLAAPDDRPAFGAVAAAVGTGLADLGIEDTDVEAQESVARLLVELDVDGEGMPGSRRG